MIGFELVLAMMLVTAGVQAQSYSIGGKTYIPTAPTETVGAAFALSDGGVTTGGYSGLVRLVVTGSGVSCTPATNDAFYIYEWRSGCGNPNVVPQHDPNYYQLTFDSKTLPALAVSRDATRFIYFDIDAGVEVLSRPYVPAYRTDHTYGFIVDTGLVSAAQLHFGVSDGGFGDNSGAYQILVAQLTEVPGGPAQVVSFSPNATPPFVPGVGVTWTATATGGVAPLQYEFWLYNYGTTNWTVLQGYSSASQVTWTPAAVGTYGLQVWVRSAGSVASYEGWQNYGPFEVKLAPVMVTELTTATVFPVPPHTPVTWTATATGGTAPLEYQFWLYHFQTATWALLRAYGPEASVTWTPSEVGQYRVQVWVRSVGAVGLYEAWRNSEDVLIADARTTLTAVTAQPPLPVPVSIPVTFTATGTGGVAPLQYRFWLYDYGTTSWTLLQDYSPANQVMWTPPGAGTYGLQVWVRSAGSTAAWEDWQGLGPFSVFEALTVTSFTPNVAPPVTVGTPVTLTAMTAGGVAPVEYRFYLYNAGTASWTLLQDYSATDHVVWTPTAAGVYGMQVWVRSAGSTAAYEAWQGLGPFTVVPTPVTVTALTPSTPVPLAVGVPMTWTATATGGVAPLQYQFWLYRVGSGWTLLQDYGPSNQAPWTPKTAGTYALQVWVRGAGSTVAYEAWRSSGLFQVQ
jgi:hypothetical protein